MTRKEKHLYPEIENWFNQYLTDKYKGYDVTTTHRTSRIALDSYLRTIKVEVPEALGLSIKVDIVGVLQKGKEVRITFIEVKDVPLTLSDRGQLWGYTQLINPVESFLISSVSLGTLEHILKVLKREDLLMYGAKPAKMMKVCKWDSRRKSIDYSTLIPKI